MRYLLMFLVLAAMAACSPVRKYIQRPEVLAWENDIRYLEHLDSTEIYSENAILFTGSSSIRLWSTLSEDMAPYPVIQRGYGGARLSDFALYAERIIYPHSCSAIVIFIANDITGNEDDKSPEEVARLFRHILKIIRNKKPEVPVFWIAVTPTVLRWKVWPDITDAANRIEQICHRKNNTYFVRTDFAFLNDARLPRAELFQSDSLHLNEQGYAVWTEIIKKELSGVLGY